ncbi:UNVERIFIED_CONTAM: hypothetical protein FKN15_040132 [Acipenser sinensis]
MQQEHVEELRAAQREVMRVRQQLSQLSQDKEAAVDEAQRLSSALEVATATKCKEELSQQVSLRITLEESHDALLQRVQDMEKVVEVERGQSSQLALHKQQEENARLKSEISSLSSTAEEVQSLNDQLDKQGSQLSTALRSLTMENARLITEHQATLKEQQQRVVQKLQEQDLLLDVARANIQGELQGALSEKLQLQKHLVTVFRAASPLEVGALSSALQKQEEENRRLLERLAALEHQQHAQQQVEHVLAELTESKNKLAYDKGKLQVVPVRKTLEVAREDNRKLAQSLEQALLANSSLQSKLNRAQHDVDSKESQLQQLHNLREQEVGESRQETWMFTERLESLKKQFKSERETARRAAQKELVEGDPGEPLLLRHPLQRWETKQELKLLCRKYQTQWTRSEAQTQGGRICYPHCCVSTLKLGAVFNFMVHYWR